MPATTPPPLLLPPANDAVYVKPLALVAVPPIVVTVTLLAPTVPAGVLAVIEVALTTTMLVAATPFTCTLVAPVKLAPVIVISVSPLVGPEGGEIEVIVGRGTNLNALGLLIVPPAVAMVTLITPAKWAGVVILNDVPVLLKIGIEVP